jgi:hypothetical protein
VSAAPKEAQPDLLAAPLDAETWLLERLKQHGIDVYASTGQFDSLPDRLAHVIAQSGFGPIVAGRHHGKPETYAQFVLRAFGIKLSKTPKQNATQEST